MTLPVLRTKSIIPPLSFDDVVRTRSQVPRASAVNVSMQVSRHQRRYLLLPLSHRKLTFLTSSPTRKSRKATNAVCFLSEIERGDNVPSVARLGNGKGIVGDKDHLFHLKECREASSQQIKKKRSRRKRRC